MYVCIVCKKCQACLHFSVHSVYWLHAITLCLFSVCSVNEKVLRETQTLCAGCSKAEPKNFAPPQTPFPGAQDGQNWISWRWSLPLPTDPVWWRSMHAISSCRGNSPTHKQTHKPTNTQTRPITIHCAAASTQCNERMIVVTADPTARMCHSQSGMAWFICLIVSLLLICLTLLVTCVHADYHVFKLL